MNAVRTILVLCGLGLVACSGASSPEIGDPAVKNESSTTEPASPSPGGATTSPAKSPDPSGKVTSPDDKKPKDPPLNPACVNEIEGNESAAKATPFTSCIAGTLAGRDNDYLRIVAPADVERMHIEHTESGQVLYRVSEDDTDTLLSFDEMFIDKAPELHVKPGATYIFRLTAATGAPGPKDDARSYELKVSFR